MNHCASALAVLAVATLISSANGARVPAFPGAEGAGTFATGGRGGRVIYVSNLNDSGPGSLREAVEAKGPRTVLFKTSGTIELRHPLRVREPFLTIAGQSAPGDGICLKRCSFMIETHDVVVRFIRSRLGPEGGKAEDAISIGTGARNVIADHCSASWSVDELLSTSGTNINGVTVQWCIIAEALNKSVHPKGEHGYGSLIRADGDVTYHHNIYAHNKSRNPRPGSYGEGRGLLLDFRNNLIYDWGERAGYTSEDPATINYVANYLKSGPSTRRLDEAFNVGGAETKLYA
ncbi:MAG TPA: pectate lyase, partial [Verrucomicrobiae bacterium]